MAHDEELERAIAGYREALATQAGLAAADAGELEDHLRALIDELRAAGQRADAAFAEAVRRVGDPAALGREYARVKPLFGARLPAWRIAATAALLAPLIASTLRWLLEGRVGPRAVVAGELALAVVVVAALVLGRTWARAVLLGASAASLAGAALFALSRGQPLATPELALPLGALVVLAPWRRGELTSAGWALATVSLAYAGVGWAAAYAQHGLGGELAGFVAAGCLLAGAAGVILRARWASAILLAGAAAIALVGWRLAGALPASETATLAASALALAAGAALSWRDARPGFGSLRGILA